MSDFESCEKPIVDEDYNKALLILAKKYEVKDTIIAEFSDKLEFAKSLSGALVKIEEVKTIDFTQDESAALKTAIKDQLELIRKIQQRLKRMCNQEYKTRRRYDLQSELGLKSDANLGKCERELSKQTAAGRVFRDFLTEEGFRSRQKSSGNTALSEYFIENEGNNQINRVAQALWHALGFNSNLKDYLPIYVYDIIYMFMDQSGRTELANSFGLDGDWIDILEEFRKDIALELLSQIEQYGNTLEGLDENTSWSEIARIEEELCIDPIAPSIERISQRALQQENAGAEHTTDEVGEAVGGGNEITPEDVDTAMGYLAKAARPQEVKEGVGKSAAQATH